MSSATPNDPFNQSQSPTGAAPPATQKSGGGKSCLWVTGLVGALCMFGCLACCGVGYWVFGMLSDSYRQQLDGNPVIAEHIGEIESMQLDFAATAEEADNPDCDIAYSISGSLASGTVLIKQDQGGDGTGIAKAELVLPDGSRYPIPLGTDGADMIEDFQIDLGEIDAEIEPLQESIEE